MLRLIAELLIAYVAFYPLATSALWIAGGIMFAFDDRDRLGADPNPGPDATGVSLLIPAYDEAEVIADAVKAALALDYPNYEVLVLDDGSTDRTSATAEAAGAGDRRLRVVRSRMNLGKADRLNEGLKLARNPLVMVVDADAQVHPAAMRMLVARIERTPKLGAVAGDPRVTNRGSTLAALQVLEFSSIIGLIRRTQAVGGTVGTVAGIIGIFKRDAVLSVGGYDARMATEDIDLTYRLLLAGWETDYEPRALIGMEVPTGLRILWSQRRRWARGQGEVLRTHFRRMMSTRNPHLWPVAGESLCSLMWVHLSFVVFTLLVIDWIFDTPISTQGFALAWGIAVGVVSILQLAIALLIDRRYDRSAALTFALGPIYPAAYWLLSAAAAISSEGPALLRGPRREPVRWNTPRTALPEPGLAPGQADARPRKAA
jgi:biofilm PGA synthesis N-glycosyltransferase PgaC